MLKFNFENNNMKKFSNKFIFFSFSNSLCEKVIHVSS